MEIYTGFVKRILYHNPVNGYSVFTLKPKNSRQIKCVGSHLGLRENAHLEVSGEHEDDPRWGEQFKFFSAIELMPSDSQGLIRYLSSVSENVGEEVAEAVVRKFGRDTEKVLKREPWRLEEVEGVGKKRAQALAEAFAEMSDRQDLALWLVKAGLTHKLSNRAIAFWHDDPDNRGGWKGGYTYAEIKSKVLADPYILIEVPGVGFRTADSVGSTLGVPRDHPGRIRAGLVWVLNDTIGMGHCWIDRRDLCAHALSLLACDFSSIEAGLGDHLSSGSEMVAVGDRIYPTELRVAEQTVASQVNKLSMPEDRLSASYSEDVIFRDLDPSVGQRRVVDLLRQRSMVVITGGPGCLHADTPIVDPVDGSVRTVRERYESGKGFYVYALGPGGPVIAKADRPYKYPRARMIRFRFDDGSEIVVTGGHRFWNGVSWVLASDVYGELQEFGVFRLPTISDNDLSAHVGGDHHLTERVRGSLGDCQEHHCSCDEQLHQASSSGPASLPSPGGVVNAKLIGMYPYYDFHVPVYENYWACGVWNHNTGKTWITKALLAGAQNYGAEVSMCAPTGKAARRMTQLTGHRAFTIHRLLGWKPDGFYHDVRNPLDCDFIISDEMSMTCVELASSLLSAIRLGATVVIVGDVDQLPSVGPGCVLRDLIDSNAVPVVRLKTVHRQALESKIIEAAHIINNATDGYKAVAKLEGLRSTDFRLEIVGDDGHDPRAIADRVLEVAQEFADADVDVTRDLQVMAPMKKGDAGVWELNKRLTEVFNPVESRERAKLLGGFAAGDRVMHIVNNYKLKVFNGMAGVIDTAGANKLVVRYSDLDEDQLVEYDVLSVDELMPAACCTVHKSQGSEYPYVIVAMHSGQHFMLSKNLIYTAVTRAEKTCVVVGNRRGLATAVETVKRTHRRTGLRELLEAGYREDYHLPEDRIEDEN